MNNRFDCAVVGGGIMGCSVALFLARGGMRVVLLDRGPLCRQASGVNAGTLTMQMVRAALIPYALRAWQMWMQAPSWLDGADVLARARPGLSLAFTEQEEAMVAERARLRRAAGAPIELIGPARACAIEPGLNPAVRMAGYCPMDGFASAYLTGRALRHALINAGVEVRENCHVQNADLGFVLRTTVGPIRAAQLVLAGGIWLEPMAAWFGVRLPIRCLINQLAVTERQPCVMRTVLGVASGLLSLKQFENGTVLIGGGWQGTGDREGGPIGIVPANLIGNLRLAAYTIPALRRSRVVRAWLGLEGETADALPVVGPVPSVPRAWIIGCVHSGYTSGPCMGKLLAQAILGETPEMPLFPVDRLLQREAA
jgi:glycine/D-amino acid oxidase-like deaminating enzyme